MTRLLREGKLERRLAAVLSEELIMPTSRQAAITFHTPTDHHVPPSGLHGTAPWKDNSDGIKRSRPLR